MNKKAFTLIEVLVVLVIVSIIVVISIPSITDMLDKSKQKSKEEVVSMIKTAAEMYALDFDIGLSEPIYISELCKNYLKCPVNNPINDEEVNGYLYGRIDTSNNNAVVYELIIYSDPDVPQPAIQLDTTILATVGAKDVNVNKYAGNGLYKWGNEYIYRGGITKSNVSGLQTSNGYLTDTNSGTNVNNYIVVPWDRGNTNCTLTTNTCYRIVSINSDGSINIVRDRKLTTPLLTPFIDTLYGTTGYEELVIKSYKSMLEKMDVCMNQLGTVIGVNNPTYLTSNFVKDTCDIVSKAGVLPVYPLKSKYIRTLYAEEYLNVSTEATCTQNAQYQCRNQNYLYNGEDSRLINVASSNPALNYYVSISGNIGTSVDNAAFRIRPLVTLRKNIIITGGNGAQNNPYVIAN